ncbi:MAG TPA: hypothetical protein VF911_11930 [Thermoanaerobaculia bacterium]
MRLDPPFLSSAFAIAAALVPYFPGNTLRFWLVTSAVCLVAGLLHLIGLKQIALAR